MNRSDIQNVQEVLLYQQKVLFYYRNHYYTINVFSKLNKRIEQYNITLYYSLNAISPWDKI